MGLAITRYEGESIQIGPDIRIDIMRVWAGQVRVHIDAPRNLPISRGNAIAHPPSLKVGELEVSPSLKTHPDHDQRSKHG